MAADLNLPPHSSVVRFLRLLAATFAWGFCAEAQAQTLVDPTRPPQAPTQSVAVDSQALAAQVTPIVVVTAKEGVLALIDDRIVRVGSRFKEGSVVRITADAVFVRLAQGKVERLPVFPEVSIQPTAAPPIASTPGERDKREPTYRANRSKKK